jgi:hypothetical protein
LKDLSVDNNEVESTRTSEEGAKLDAVNERTQHLVRQYNTVTFVEANSLQKLHEVNA